MLWFNWHRLEEEGETEVAPRFSNQWSEPREFCNTIVITKDLKSLFIHHPENHIKFWECYQTMVCFQASMIQTVCPLLPLIPKVEHGCGILGTSAPYALGSPDSSQIMLLTPLLPSRRKCMPWNESMSMRTSSVRDLWTRSLQVYQIQRSRWRHIGRHYWLCARKSWRFLLPRQHIHIILPSFLSVPSHSSLIPSFICLSPYLSSSILPWSVYVLYVTNYWF